MSQEFLCSYHAPAEAWTERPPAAYKILSDQRLPYLQDRFGRRSLYYHLGNFSPDMPNWKQISILRDSFDVINHELWPLCFQSSVNLEGAECRIYFVDNDDWVYIDGVQEFKSPFLFSKSPKTLAVTFPWIPGYQYALHIFINDRYTWSDRHQTGSQTVVAKHDFKVMFIHEFFHALGLDHTTADHDILRAIYDPNGVITNDTRKGLDFLQGGDRREAFEVDPAALYLRERLKEPLPSELKINGGCVAKAISWLQKN